MRGPEITIKDFTGGLVLDSDPSQLAANQMARCDNVVFTESDMPRKRNGYAKFYAEEIAGGAHTIRGGLSTFYDDDDEVYRVICNSTGVWELYPDRPGGEDPVRQLKQLSLRGYVQMLQTGDYMFITVGGAADPSFRPLKYWAMNVEEAGYPRPTAGCVTYATGDDGNLDGEYRYRFAWLFEQPDGTYKESDPSVESRYSDTDSGMWQFATDDWQSASNETIKVHLPVSLTGRVIGLPARKQVVGWRLYRFKHGFSTEYEWVGDSFGFSGSNAYIIDNLADGDEGDPHDALRLEDPLFHAPPPAGVHLCAKHDERLFLARTDEYRNRIWWSNQGEPEYFQAESAFAEEGGYRDVNPNDGDEITALVSSGGVNLLVLKTASVWSLREEFDGGYGAYKVGDGVGCVATHSVAVTPLGAVWLGRDGHVWVYDGTAFRDIAKGRVATRLRAMEPEDAANCVGFYYNRHYYLAYHDVDVTPKDSNGVEETWHSDTFDRRRNNCILAYDIDRDCWIQHWRYPREDDPPTYTRALPVTAAFVGRPDDDQVCLFGFGSGSYIYQWDRKRSGGAWNAITDDDGVAIEAVLRTGDMDFGSLGWKRAGRVHISAYPTGASDTWGIYQRKNRGDWSEATDVALSATRGGIVEKDLGAFAARFKTMALQARYLGTAEQAEFWGFSFRLMSKGVR